MIAAVKHQRLADKKSTELSSVMRDTPRGKYGRTFSNLSSVFNPFFRWGRKAAEQEPGEETAGAPGGWSAAPGVPWCYGAACLEVCRSSRHACSPRFTSRVSRYAEVCRSARKSPPQARSCRPYIGVQERTCSGMPHSLLLLFFSILKGC